MKRILLLQLLVLFVEVLTFAQPRTIASSVIKANNSLSDPGNWRSTVPKDIEADINGNIYAIGSFQRGIDLPIYVSNWPYTGSYLMRYSSSGALLSGGRIGYDPESIIVDIETDASGNIFYVGSYPSQGTGSAIEITKSGSGVWWQHTIDGATTGSDYATNGVVDNSGNVYVTGIYSGNTVNFAPNETPQFLGNGGNFLVTYSPTGSFIRGFSVPFTISGITISSSTIILFGTFSGTVDFDLGLGTANRTSTGVNSFIAKYTQTGDLIWVNQFTSNFVTKASTVDASGNIVVSGNLSGTCDLDPGVGVQSLSSTGGSTDILLAKYDQNGLYQFAFNIGNTNTDEGRSVKTDVAGNIYLSGIYRSATAASGWVDFDPGTGSTTLAPAYFAGSPGETEFLAKYDPTGAFRWVTASSYRGDDTFIDIDAQQNILWHYEETDNGQIGASVAQVRKFDQAPSVTSFALANSSGGITKAPAGNTIRILGNNFSLVPTENTVTFVYNGNSVSASVLASTLNSITVQIPVGVTPGLVSQTVQVNVFVNGFQASRNFVISVPSITSINTQVVGQYIDLITDTGRDGSLGTISYSITSGSSRASLAGNRLSLTGIGAIAIQASIAGDANYNLATANQVITSNPKIISANTGISGATIPLSTNIGTSTGTIVYTVINNSGSATVSGSNLILGNVGTVTITASIAADANNSSATTTQAITITCIPNPSITLGTIEALVVEPTTITLPPAQVPYSASGAPDQYRIDWNPAAINAGLINVPYTSLPGTQISIPGIPAIAGTYSGTLYVRNELNGCSESAGRSFTVNVQNSSLSPIISGFAPVSGSIGTPVTITGTNFNINPNSNAVFFGATRASITSNSNNQLIVIVPKGATNEKITVTNVINGRTGYSGKPFLPTFSCGDVQLATFSPKVDIGAAQGANKIVTSDFDGDGNPDLAMGNTSGASISVFRNLGTGNVPFSSASVNVSVGSAPNSIAVGDLDGDGKQEMTSVNYSSNTLAILRNTSTVGNISFTNSLSVTTGLMPYDVAIGDLSGDGRPEIVFVNNGGGNVSILQNSSTVGNISFLAAVNISLGSGSGPRGVSLSDIDGDSKPDIVVANASANTVSILKNNWGSSPSFTLAATLVTDQVPTSIFVGDLNGDDKPEIATANYYSNNVSIFKNISSTGILFESKIPYSVGSRPWAITFGDVDGNGKLDILVPNFLSNSVSVLKNTGVSGAISFVKVDFTTGVQPSSVYLADLNGDDRPDLSVSNRGSAFFSVLKSELRPTIVNIQPSSLGETKCQNDQFTPLTVSGSGTGNLQYQWYKNTISAYNGSSAILGATNSNFTPPSDITGTTYYFATITGICTDSSNFSGPIKVNPKPSTSSITGSSSVCANSTTTYSVPSTPGSTYLWSVTGGIPNSSINDNSFTVKWGSSGTGSLSLIETNSYGCTTSLSRSITKNQSPYFYIDGVKLDQVPIYPFDCTISTPYSIGGHMLEVLNSAGSPVTFGVWRSNTTVTTSPQGSNKLSISAIKGNTADLIINFSSTSNSCTINGCVYLSNNTGPGPARKRPGETVLEENSLGMGIYPNPANSEALVVLSSKAETDCPVQFIDVSGRVLISGIVSKGTIEKSFTLEALNTGIYIVHFSDNGVHRYKKLIVSKE